MISRPPTAEEINVFNSLDERFAVEHFLGKDLARAEALFRDNFLFYQEDLMWMGPKAFRFYLPAAINFLLGTESAGGSDAASSFCGVLKYRLDSDPDEIDATGRVIQESILRILANFERFGCSREIYGDVAARYRDLLSRLGA